MSAFGPWANGSSHFGLSRLDNLLLVWLGAWTIALDHKCNVLCILRLINVIGTPPMLFVQNANDWWRELFWDEIYTIVCISTL